MQIHEILDSEKIKEYIFEAFKLVTFPLFRFLNSLPVWFKVSFVIFVIILAAIIAYLVQKNKEEIYFVRL